MVKKRVMLFKRGFKMDVNRSSRKKGYYVIMVIVVTGYDTK